MNSYRKYLIKLTLLLSAAALSLTACRTLEYRTVQTDFEQAVRADNAGSPFSRQHEDVIDRLTPDYIAKLDPKLQPNAWMLRSVSAWRAGNTNAEESAKKGLACPALVPGSRDQIVLIMIPALTTDFDLQQRWIASNRKVSGADYTTIFEPSFKAALRQLSETTEAAMNEKTPVDAHAYCDYQHWRILQNWEAVIATVTPPAAMFAAHDRATNFVGAINILDAAKVQRDKIPNDHPLRALIRAQGGGG